MTDYANFDMNADPNVKAYAGATPKPDSGDYTVMISKSDSEINKNANGTNLVMVYTILDGPFQGAEVKEWLAVNNNSKQAEEIARSKMKAVQTVSGKLEQSDPKSMTGETIRIRVIKKPHTFVNNNGETVNTFNVDVVNYMTLEGKNANGDVVPAFTGPAVQGGSTTTAGAASGGDAGGGATGGQDQDTGPTQRDVDDEIPF